MKVFLNQKPKITIHQVCLKSNEVLVERAGYVPLSKQVERAFTAGQIREWQAKMRDPNGQLGKIEDDITSVIENNKDNLTLLSYAKDLSERINFQRAKLAEQQAQAADQMRADAEAYRSMQIQSTGPEATL